MVNAVESVMKGLNKQERVQVEQHFQGHARLQQQELRSGTEMLDMFQPKYFATAFAFLFKRSWACPDLVKQKSRFRRPENAPWVSIERWCHLMVRRVESQLKRDWVLSFTLWRVLFHGSLLASQQLFGSIV